ncbi:hypothetical protein G6F22_010924 [Rhizopus arrhizus]|nr:hypothetical protein G6F22_010924 [Rhizopus arrhizus]
MKTRQEQGQEQEQEGSENEGQDSDHNNVDVNIQLPTTVRIDKIADTITDHGELNVVNNKRPLPFTDIFNNATVTPITSTTPLASTSINKGSNTYVFDPPCTPTERPHMPKIRKGELETLDQLFVFGTQYCISDPLCKTEYNNNKEQQLNNSSLCSLGLLDDLIFLLRKVPYDDFLNQVWNWKGDPKIDDQSKNFLIVCKHILSTFHLVHQTPPMHVVNHERSFFCESILPGLLALSKMIKFIEFKWCEAKYKATKQLYLKDGNYDGRSTPPAKYIDALGILKTHNNMEMVVVESASGMVEEHTTHSLEDSVKILECNVAALREEACHYENASLETFRKLGAYGVQIIKTQVTLSKTMIHDKNRWKSIEMRSAQIPRTWDDRLLILKYLELLGTLYIELLHAQEVESKLLEERVNVDRPSGPFVRSIME